MINQLTRRRIRYLIAEVDTSTGVERIVRTIALDALGPEVRERLAPLHPWDGWDGWDGGVLVLDGRLDARYYVLPHIHGVIARWDLLLEAHRRAACLAAATDALAAMGHANGHGTGPLAQWIADGADDRDPGAGKAFVPPPRTPVTEDEWFAIERRAQLMARLFPVARDLNPDDPVPLAIYIASRLIESPRRPTFQ
jgi:hypothetical protein